LSEPVVQLDDVVRSFTEGGRRTCALDHLTAAIEGGRITGLVGPDGAGKTTLMRLITGLLPPDSGSVTVLGLDSVRDAQAIQSKIAYMPQRFGLYEDLSVIENLDLYADLQGLAGAGRKARFERLLTFAGLTPFTRRLAGRLSGGMKQKLGLVCTLVRPPPLLLLDEPSVGVDPVSRRELWQMVADLVTKEGISVLWSTAYLDEAARCEHVLLLSGGRLLAADTPAALTGPLAGRVFALALAGADKRAAAALVRAVPGVLDAVIKGRAVHVLLEAPEGAEALTRVAAEHADSLAPPKAIEPGFEDAFIALLRADRPAAPSAPAAVSEPPVVTGKTDGPVIRVAGLRRRFGTFEAVAGIDFTVSAGEIFGLLGPNGAGKSTTFRMLCGLLPPSDGTALVMGIDLRRAAAVARGRVGYMAQKFSLYGNMSVAQNLDFFARVYGLAAAERRRAIAAAIDDFALAEHVDLAAETLPLGFKQRLALACAIMHRPGVLFLDEPTSGVDPLVRREFWSRINAMATAGVTVMVTTHFMEEAEYCDRIGIIYRGRLAASGTPDKIRLTYGGSEDATLDDAFVTLIEQIERKAAA